MSKLFLLILFMTFLSVSATQTRAEPPSNASNSEGVCYYKDEFLAESILNYMFAQAATAVKCDDLLGGNGFSELHVSIFETHSDTIEEFTKPIEAMLKRNEWDDEEYVLSIIQNSKLQTQNVVVNKVVCDQFFVEMKHRKGSWERIISPILAEIVISDFPEHLMCPEDQGE